MLYISSLVVAMVRFRKLQIKALLLILCIQILQ